MSNRIVIVALGVALGFALVACSSSEARIESSSPDAVTVLYPVEDRAAAEKLATDECAKYNKRARSRSTTDRSNEKHAIFDCIT